MIMCKRTNQMDIMWLKYFKPFFAKLVKLCFISVFKKEVQGYHKSMLSCYFMINLHLKSKIKPVNQKILIWNDI